MISMNKIFSSLKFVKFNIIKSDYYNSKLIYLIYEIIENNFILGICVK